MATTMVFNTFDQEEPSFLTLHQSLNALLSFNVLLIDEDVIKFGSDLAPSWLSLPFKTNRNILLSLLFQLRCNTYLAMGCSKSRKKDS